MLAQAVLFRELAVLFLGQEMALGVALSAWLLGTGAGALRGGSSDPKRVFPVRLGMLALAAPLGVLLIRCSSQLVPAGELPGLFTTVILPFVLLALPCWLLGAVFVEGAALAAASHGPLGPARIYLWESLGALAGGCLSALFFFRGWHGFTVLAAGGMLLCLLALTLSPRASRRRMGMFLAGAVLLSGFSRTLDFQSRRLQWRNYDIVRQRETPYQHVLLARLGELRILFENGAISTHYPDPAAQEDLVHWPLLAHPAPRRVLALGTPAAVAAGEILKHPVESVDLVTPDPATLELLPIPESPRLHVHRRDPRLWIKRHPDTYDVIVQAMPEPQNAAFNRLFTTEFFAEAHRALRSHGVLAFTLASSENYLPPELAYIDACILRTAGQVFPFVEEIPGSRLIVLASDRPIPLDPKQLAKRYNLRQIRNRLLVPEMFAWVLHPERKNALRLRLQDAGPAKINSDLWPVSLFHLWRVWLAKLAGPGPLVGLAAAFLGSLALVRWLWRRRASGPLPPESLVLGAVGFAGMSLEMVLLFMFQAASGSLYWQLGVLFAAFMGGLAAGSAAFAYRKPARPARLLVLASAALIPLGVILAWKAPMLLTLSQPLAVFGNLLALAGFLVGSSFALAVALEPDQAGTLYAADLWGSASGALLSGLFFIPLLGHPRTLLLIAFTLSLALAFYFLTSRTRQTPRS